MAEQDELRLTVSLVDNASAGVIALRQNIAALSSGPAAASMEKFKRQQQDMTKVVKDMTDVALSGEKAMIGMIARFGAAGVAIGGLATLVGKAASSLADLDRASKTLGLPTPQVVHFTREMQKYGLSLQEAQANIESMAKAQATLRRGNDPNLLDLRRHAADITAMDAMIKATLALNNLEERHNLIRANYEHIIEVETKAREKAGIGHTQALLEATEIARVICCSVRRNREGDRQRRQSPDHDARTSRRA